MTKVSYLRGAVGLALALLAGCAAAHGLRAGADIGFRYEPGVETKLALSGMAEWSVNRRVTLTGLLAAAALDNAGLARYRFGVKSRVIDAVSAGWELDVAHEEWSSWQTGENRVAGAVVARPFRKLELGLGAAWRVPVTGPSYRSPFVWQSDAPEWNYVYRIRWEFLNAPRMEATAFVANLDRFGMHTPQQFPFGVEGTFALKRGIRLTGRIGSAIKGLSGLLISLAELDAHLGVSHEY
jgi:hypothetical protein